MRSTFKVHFYLKRNEVRKEDGKAPIYARVTVDGNPKSFGTKKFIEPELWDTKGNMVTGRSNEAKLINAYLKDIETGCKNHYDTFIKEENYANSEKVVNAYLGLDMKCNTILQVLQRHNEEFRKMVDGGSRSKSTYTKYLTVYNHLKAFIKYKYNCSDMGTSLQKLQIQQAVRLQK